MRILRVRGTGKLSRSPDLVVMRFIIKSLNMDYEKALQDVNMRTAILKQDIEKAGFKRDDLKTTRFSVDTKYKYENDQTIFLGYEAIHEMTLTFTYQKQTFNQLLRLVTKSQAHPEFQIQFELEDKKKFENDLLQKAVMDATEKAKVITTTANIRLGKIVNITYDPQKIIPQSKLMMENVMLTSTADIDVTPSDVTSELTIVIEWEIEDYI